MHLGYIWAAKAGRTTCRGLGELANGIALLLTSALPACRLPRASSSGLEVKAVQEHARCGPSACRVPSMRGACVFRNLCGTCVRLATLPGFVARIEAPKSVTLVLV